MWRFLTGVMPPPQKKAKLSKTDARYEKEKRKREPQRTWKDKRLWLQFTPDGTMICSYCVDAKFFFLTGNQGFIRAYPNPRFWLPGF